MVSSRRHQVIEDDNIMSGSSFQYSDWTEPSPGPEEGWRALVNPYLEQQRHSMITPPFKQASSLTIAKSLNPWTATSWLTKQRQRHSDELLVSKSLTIVSSDIFSDSRVLVLSRNELMAAHHSSVMNQEKHR